METFELKLWIALAAWSFFGVYAGGTCWAKIEAIPRWYKKGLYLCMFGPLVVGCALALVLIIGVLICLEWLFNKSRIENTYYYISLKFNNWLMK